jgi:hypothetical protein
MDTSEVVNDILSHTGVKGMKWGVRRKATVGAQEVIVSDKRIGKGIKTSGGKGHPASSEAVSARKIGQIGKKSGLSSLSNKQLQEYNQRLNLEQQAKRLRFQDQNVAKRFVMTALGRRGPGAAETALKSNYARKKIASGVAALAIAA